MRAKCESGTNFATRSETIVVGSHFDHEDGEVWVILGRERIERFVQPCPVPTGHDYCDHCGRGLFRAHTKINSVAGPPGPLRVLSSNG